jgi:hypothetical protein
MYYHIYTSYHKVTLVDEDSVGIKSAKSRSAGGSKFMFVTVKRVDYLYVAKLWFSNPPEIYINSR